jgi:Na+/H+-dicarboxylate symporter
VSRKSAVHVALALLAGFVAGALLRDTVIPRVFEPIGTLWVNAIRMPVLPLIVCLLVTAIGGARDVRTVGSLAFRTLAVFLVLQTFFEIIMSPAAVALMANLRLDPVSTEALRRTAQIDPSVLQQLSLKDWLLTLIPANPVGAAADGALLPLVIFSLAYGLALSRVSESLRGAHVMFLRGVAEAMSQVIRWVLAAAPIGVFGLAVAVGAHLGIAGAGAIGYYIVAVCLLLIIALGMLYVITARGARVPLRTFAAALIPAQTVAVTSRSSLASLPVLMSDTRSKLGLSESVTGFVLPLGASIFKLNAPMNWLLGALLVARLYGVEFSGAKLVVFCVGTIVLSFAVPGIPSGGFFVQAPLYTAVGLPPEGLGILIAVDLVPDIFKTVLNVTSYAGAGLLVARLEGRAPDPAADAVAEGAEAPDANNEAPVLPSA